MSAIRRAVVTAVHAIGLWPRAAHRRMKPSFAGVVDATIADIPEIVRMELPIFREHQKFHPQDFQQTMNESVTSAFYRQALFSDNWGAAVYVAEGSTIGYIAWMIYEQFEGRHALIHSIAVDPVNRRRGIARALLAHAEEKAAEKKITSLRANIWAHNEDSHAFFAANGFTPVAQTVGRSIRRRAQ